MVPSNEHAWDRMPGPACALSLEQIREPASRPCLARTQDSGEERNPLPDSAARRKAWERMYFLDQSETPVEMADFFIVHVV